MLKFLLKLRNNELFLALTVFVREDTSNELSITMKYMFLTQYDILDDQFLSLI